MYKDTSITRYLDDLSAKIPAPGGGSAAALTAAMGAALMSMVINFTVGKSQYQKFDEELKELLVRTEKFRIEFMRLMDLDVIAYQSKDIRQALDVPLIVARLCSDAIEICPTLIKKGNVNLISDVSVAGVLLESAFASACVNVDINLKYLKDEVFVESVRSEIEKKRHRIQKVRNDTEVKVGEIIRG